MRKYIRGKEEAHGYSRKAAAKCLPREHFEHRDSFSILQFWSATPHQQAIACLLFFIKYLKLKFLKKHSLRSRVAKHTSILILTKEVTPQTNVVEVIAMNESGKEHWEL